MGRSVPVTAGTVMGAAIAIQELAKQLSEGLAGPISSRAHTVADLITEFAVKIERQACELVEDVCENCGCPGYAPLCPPCIELDEQSKRDHERDHGPGAS